MDFVLFLLSERVLVFPNLLRNNLVSLVCIKSNCMVWSRWYLVYDCDEYFFFLQGFFLATFYHGHSNLWNARAPSLFRFDGRKRWGNLFRQGLWQQQSKWSLRVFQHKKGLWFLAWYWPLSNDFFLSSDYVNRKKKGITGVRMGFWWLFQRLKGRERLHR